MLNLNISISALSGVGPKIQEKFESMGLLTVKDLLFYFPRRWDDFRNFTPISWCRRDEEVTIKGKVVKVSKERTKLRNMTIVKARIADETGEITAVWFNQGYIDRMLFENLKVTLHGKVDWDWKNKERILASPTLVKEEKIVPVYSESCGIASKIYERIIRSALLVVENLEEWLPEEIKDEYDLIDLAEAIKQIHNPSSFEALDAAKQRLAFDELFMIALSMAQVRAQNNQEEGMAFNIDEALLKQFVDCLPFKLTDAQRKTAWEIMKDLKKPHPMNRLVEGDVGSGKTVVGVMAVLMAIKNGKQAAWMAPTSILAEQHFLTMQKLLVNYDVSVGLLTSGRQELKILNSKSENLPGSPSQGGNKSKIQNPNMTKPLEADIIIGTQALIQEKVKLENLGLVIIDEQHRFGVSQRGALRNSKLQIPHFLSMTATPIPRTLALALYGDLDISIIDEMPSGRKQVVTKAISPDSRAKTYDFMRDQITSGRQVFVICPLIEQKVKNTLPTGRQEEKKIIENSQNDEMISEIEIESLSQIELFEVEKKAVVSEYEKLSKEIFPDLKIGLLHGKLKAKEKEVVMKNFAEGNLNLLVSTAVVEVGIDIPNATVMMIEGAERFGLAQLHQFRGRVGRGEHQSYCLLFAESWSENTKARLKALVESNNGFELAEKDLQLRGPGELVGIKQSGLPDLKMASLTDTILIRKARNGAQKIVENGIDHYPLLKTKLDEFQKTRHLE